MTGNLLRGGINRVFGENKPAIRGCMTQKARAYVDSENLYVINGIGGINSNVDLPSSYLPNKSEILDNNSDSTAYHRTDDQKNTAAEVKSTAEGTAQSQRMQSANSGYMLSGKSYDKTIANEKNRWVFDSTLGDGSNRGKPNDGYPDYSFALQWTEIRDLNKQIPRDMRGASSNSSSYVFPQNFGIQRLGLSTTQDSAGSGTYDGDVRHSSEAYVTQNTTGDGFMADIAEREAFGKMPLPSYLGYGVKDNYDLVELILENYKNKLAVAAVSAKAVVPPIALEVAEKAIVLLPPNLRVPAMILLCSLDVYITAKDAYDKWNNKVDTYAQVHKCSRVVAEQNVSLEKEFLDAFMFTSVQAWLKHVFKSVDIPADVKITLFTELLKVLDEQGIMAWKERVKHGEE